MTLGVTILGKHLNSKIFIPFKAIDEIIAAKNSMHRPPADTNVPIIINCDKKNETIEISGRLFKNNSLSHDPNIGTLSIIAACIRKLDWTGRIVITRHGLTQSQ